MLAEVIRMPEKEEMAQEIRAWAKYKVESKGVAVATLATEAGLNRSSMSRFLNHGEYNQNMIEKLQALRERLEGSKNEVDTGEDSPAPPQPKEFKREIGIFHTEDFQRVVGLCAMCHRDGEIGVIIGQSGSGKTTSLEEFCTDRPDVVYIRAKATMSVKGLLSAIGEGLGQGAINGSKEKMVDQVVAALKDNPRTLIIDEADRLADKNSVVRLETIRDVWDETHTGMVICGMPKLAKYLVKGPGGDHNLAQIYSRIRRAYRMRGVSREELLQFMDGFNITESAQKYLLTRGATMAHGGLRRFTRILQNALDLVDENEPITLEIIKEADGLLVTPETLGFGI